MRRTSCINGLAAVMWRREGQAVLPATLEYHGAPAEWRILWTGIRYCYSCHRDTAGQEKVESDLHAAFDQGAQPGGYREVNGARQVLERGRGFGDGDYRSDIGSEGERDGEGEGG